MAGPRNHTRPKAPAVRRRMRERVGELVEREWIEAPGLEKQQRALESAWDHSALDVYGEA